MEQSEADASSHDNAAQAASEKMPQLETAAPASAKPPALAINMPSRGEHWDLPWMCFNGSRYLAADMPGTDGTQKAERLELFYVQQEVVIFGKNLLALRKTINAMTLAEICETPGAQSQCAAPVDCGRPLIISIDVKPRSR